MSESSHMPWSLVSCHICWLWSWIKGHEIISPVIGRYLLCSPVSRYIYTEEGRREPIYTLHNFPKMGWWVVWAVSVLGRLYVLCVTDSFNIEYHGISWCSTPLWRHDMETFMFRFMLAWTKSWTNSHEIMWKSNEAIAPNLAYVLQWCLN